MEKGWGWAARDVVAEEGGYVNNEWKADNHASSAGTEIVSVGFHLSVTEHLRAAKLVAMLFECWSWDILLLDRARHVLTNASR
jgi:hypothetical protein